MVRTKVFAKEKKRRDLLISEQKTYDFCTYKIALIFFYLNVFPQMLFHNLGSWKESIIYNVSLFFFSRKSKHKRIKVKTPILSFAAVQAASKTLMDSLNEIYESQWTGHDLLYVQAQNLDMLWQDFTHKLADQVLVPLNTYQSQFPEMRVRSW